MRIAGIDYSMTSPGICVYNTNSGLLSFHYGTYQKRMCLTITNPVEIHGCPLTPDLDNEPRFNEISTWAMDVLTDFDEGDVVYIEDYSMGSRGRVFHIAENAGLLKHKLWRHNIPYHALAPTTIKKEFYGKGNAKKNQMWERFLEKTGVDLLKLLGKELGSTGNVPSPVNDLVDAYAIAMCGLARHKQASCTDATQ